MSVNVPENAFHFEFEEKKSGDFAWACLSDPHFTDHLLFMTGFAAPRGDRKKQFLLYAKEKEENPPKNFISSRDGAIEGRNENVGRLLYFPVLIFVELLLYLFCTGSHFKPVPFLLEKYYLTS